MSSGTELKMNSLQSQQTVPGAAPGSRMESDRKPLFLRAWTFGIPGVRRSELLMTVLACLTGWTACASFWSTANTTPSVILAFHDTAGRCQILVRDLELPVTVAARTDLPYSENAQAALWIGTEFPWRKAIQVITDCRNYYPHIKYIALSDIRLIDGQEPGRYDLYLGAPTDRALCLGLEAWTVKQKQALLRSKTKAEFEERIRARYGNKERCVSDSAIDDSDLIRTESDPDAKEKEESE